MNPQVTNTLEQRGPQSAFPSSTNPSHKIANKKADKTISSFILKVVSWFTRQTHTNQPIHTSIQERNVQTAVKNPKHVGERPQVIPHPAQSVSPERTNPASETPIQDPAPEETHIKSQTSEKPLDLSQIKDRQKELISTLKEGLSTPELKAFHTQFSLDILELTAHTTETWQQALASSKPNSDLIHWKKAEDSVQYIQNCKHHTADETYINQLKAHQASLNQKGMTAYKPFNTFKNPDLALDLDLDFLASFIKRGLKQTDYAINKAIHQKALDNIEALNQLQKKGSSTPDDEKVIHDLKNTLKFDLAFIKQHSFEYQQKQIQQVQDKLKQLDTIKKDIDLETTDLTSLTYEGYATILSNCLANPKFKPMHASFRNDLISLLSVSKQDWEDSINSSPNNSERHAQRESIHNSVLYISNRINYKAYLSNRKSYQTLIKKQKHKIDYSRSDLDSVILERLVQSQLKKRIQSPLKRHKLKKIHAQLKTSPRQNNPLEKSQQEQVTNPTTPHRPSQAKSDFNTLSLNQDDNGIPYEYQELQISLQDLLKLDSLLQHKDFSAELTNLINRLNDKLHKTFVSKTLALSEHDAPDSFNMLLNEIDQALESTDKDLNQSDENTEFLRNIKENIHTTRQILSSILTANDT